MLFLRQTQDTAETCKSLCGKAYQYRAATSTSAISKETSSVEFAWAIPILPSLPEGASEKTFTLRKAEFSHGSSFPSHRCADDMTNYFLGGLIYKQQYFSVCAISLLMHCYHGINVHGIELRHFPFLKHLAHPTKPTEQCHSMFVSLR